ncbi:MAG TPA: hypothetical protein VNA57_01070 [Acidimicrobiales bacterium]|nr:hypothetical protein [Acidimicrobiales bacterium]
MSDPTNHPATDPWSAALSQLPAEERALFGRFLAVLEGAGSAAIECLRTRRVEVVDDHGSVRAVIGDLAGRDADVFGIAIYDASGSERANLALAEGGPLLSFSAHGDDALVIGVDDPGTTAMRPGPYVELISRAGGVAVGWRVDDESGAVDYESVGGSTPQPPGG